MVLRDRVRVLLPIVVLPLLLLSSGCALLTPRDRADAAGARVFEIWLPNATSVQVIGDWNLWGGLERPGGLLDPVVGLMQRDEEGVWTAPVPAAPGRYRYVFLVDGWQWLRDPLNPEVSTYGDRVVSFVVLER